MLGRVKAGEFLGISESGVRRLEESGALPPSFDAKGFHVHSIDQLREYKLREQAKFLPSSPEFDGHMAGAAFTLFDQGLGPADAVSRVPMGPRVARDLYRDWADLRNTFIVEGEARAKIEELGEFLEREINNSDDLTRLIQKLVRGECSSCTTHDALFCWRCCLTRSQDVIELARQSAETNRAYEEARQRRAAERRAAERAVGRANPGAGPSAGDAGSASRSEHAARPRAPGDDNGADRTPPPQPSPNVPPGGN